MADKSFQKLLRLSNQQLGAAQDPHVLACAFRSLCCGRLQLDGARDVFEKTFAGAKG